MTAAPASQPPSGFVSRAALFYRDPGASVRALADARPGDGAVVGYGILSGIGLFLAWVAVALPHGPAGATRAAEQFTAFVIARPLVYLALAAVGTLVARAFAGRGGWYEGRLGVFWAALVATPVGMAATVLAAAIPPGNETLAAIAGQIGPTYFAWAMARCFAELFGFSRPWAVFGVVAVMVLAVMAAVLYATGGGA